MLELTTAQHTVAKAMREKELSQLIFDAARKLGWLVARYPTWRPTGTVAGFPDLVLLRNGRLIFAELKSEKGEPIPAQQEWLDALREVATVYVWKPRNWLSGEIAEILGGDR